MPYKVANLPVASGKNFAIINTETNRIVGRSTDWSKAVRSMHHRLRAEREKNNKGNQS